MKLFLIKAIHIILSLLSNHYFIDKCLKRYEKVGHFICAGIDPDMSKLPSRYDQSLDGLESFLVDYIHFCNQYVLAYKPNISFFEALGIDGLKLLERMISLISSDIPIIIDAKRGDIGNTAKMQARYIFDYFNADATTLHPYMGSDSLIPFFEYKDKFNFVLVLTSNPSHNEFETLLLNSDKYVYESVLAKCSDWHSIYKNVGCVVGATHDNLDRIRAIDPNLLFLLPGVGAQGGRYLDVSSVAINSDKLCLINVSRQLMYQDDFSADSLNLILNS